MTRRKLRTFAIAILIGALAFAAALPLAVALR
jgi:hypothetical protein